MPCTSDIRVHIAMELTSVIGKVSGRDVLFALAFHSSDIKYQLIRTPLRSLLCHKRTKNANSLSLRARY